MFNAIKIYMLAVVLVLFVSSCAQVSKAPNEDLISADLSDLVLDPSQKPSTVFIRKNNTSSLADYNKFIIDPLVIDKNLIEAKGVSAEDALFIQNYFTQTMTSELNASGYEITSEPGESVLRMTFSIKDLSTPTAATNVSMLFVPGLSTSVGEVTIQAVFKESTTNQVNAVVLESSRGSYLFNSNPLSTMSDVEVALDNWAKGIRKALDKAHAK